MEMDLLRGAWREAMMDDLELDMIIDSNTVESTNLSSPKGLEENPGAADRTFTVSRVPSPAVRMQSNTGAEYKFGGWTEDEYTRLYLYLQSDKTVVPNFSQCCTDDDPKLKKAKLRTMKTNFNRVAQLYVIRNDRLWKIANRKMRFDTPKEMQNNGEVIGVLERINDIFSVSMADLGAKFDY